MSRSKSNLTFPRQRSTTKSTTSGNSPTPSSASANQDKTTSKESKTRAGISLTDLVRTLTTLLAVSLSLSYYLTSGDSLTFHYRPWFTKPTQLKAWIRGPLLLTPSELTLYNGTDPLLPIYLALNGTIYDVSVAPQTYGPGGSYHVFAGRDATRAFVTGCFDLQHLRGEVKGVERMYIPVEDLEEEEGEGQQLTRGQKKVRREQELREARRKVRAEVERWSSFYANSEKYFKVGRVVVDTNSKAEGEVPNLCEAAEKARPKRSQLNKQRAEAGKGSGKPVFKPKNGKPV
ncbi:hypothetical protein EPUS_02908 [Endocarpon pusillum Z07020]|uniref:Cytochrome b5 heme-binding domain-containing protein n=1 Tax=Endocarpon pusillum (strain Z07020 / HMAS-L-300199) TaxID=1263415 RepID=U1G4A1_ENDPU|nr:uncharacterized protein EPUS_02908 [Endocarpon pusillum Z07020]ERF72117.1 hypothetical protein EPUS_02908 [Endocarpon pusillum Z07020]